MARGASPSCPRGLSFLVLTLLSLSWLSGCGSDSALLGSGQIALSFRDKPVPLSSVSKLTFDPGALTPGASSIAALRIQNVASSGRLTIESVELVPASPSGFALVDVPTMPLVLAGAESLTVQVRFTRPLSNDPVERAYLRIESDTLREGERILVLPLVAEAALPVLSVSPELVDFDGVAVGDEASREIIITNTGDAEAVVTGLTFEGHPDFRLVPDASDDASAIAPDDEREPNLVKSWRIAPQEHRVLRAMFSPVGPAPAMAQVRLYANTAKGEHPVDLVGNANRPCIEVTPTPVEFGPRLVGQSASLPVEVRSCGDRDLSVTGIHLAENATGNFSLDLANLPTGAPSPEAPLVIPVNGKLFLAVSYAPSAVSPGDGADLVLDEAILVLESDAPGSETVVPVSGFGATELHPMAIGSIAEGGQVIPQTVLHLSALQSAAPLEGVAAWKWSVQQPPGSASVFVPSADVSNPTFEVNVAGAYRFSLDVWSESGVKSVIPWQATVLVIPDQPIHVELTWTTPNDPDETDEGVEVGSDLDLHFAHLAYAAPDPDDDPWFNMPFDVYWFNPYPNWGSLAPGLADDPSLDRDDTDGAGPENLNLGEPQDGAVYAVGVHHWTDHGYGESFATIRIYIHGVLVREASAAPMSHCDLWDVARIEWPSEKVTLMQSASGGYAITQGYSNPNFPCPN